MWFLTAALPSAFGFALFGPPNDEDGAGTVYQTDILTYNNLQGGGNVQAPKNLYQGYRWNVPVLYYSFDSTFLTYYGSNGAAQIDQAFLLISNYLSISNLSSLSSNLDAFGLEAMRVNRRAQTLGLRDLKSTTISLMLEELGIARPDRWTWCMRYRFLPSGATCPAFNYGVVQRNFDPVTLKESSFVNNVLLSYRIIENCNVNPVPINLADAVEYVNDPADTTRRFTAAASLDGIGYGTYLIGLTRDDMGGFRHLMGANTIAVETPNPGSTLLSGGYTNKNLFATLSSQDLALFAQRSVTNDGPGMVGFYPGLQVSQSSSYFTNVSTTNINAGISPSTNGAQVITNFAATQILSTFDQALFVRQAQTNPPAGLQTLYPALNIVNSTNYFTNVSTTNITAAFTPVLTGASQVITNFASTQVLTTSNLEVFARQALTNAPAALQTLYPALSIINSTNYFTNTSTTNISIAFTPYLSNATQVITNFSSPLLLTTSNLLTFAQQALTNAPAGLQQIYPSLHIVNSTNYFTNVMTTNIVTGFTNLQYSALTVTNVSTNQLLTTLDLALFVQRAKTNDGPTMQAFYPGLIDLQTYTSYSNSVIATNIGGYYTNYPWDSVITPARLVLTTNYVTNIVAVYEHVWGNVFTNNFYTNSTIATVDTIVTNLPWSPPGYLYLVTNTSSSVASNQVGGEFFLIPPTLCGYSIVSTQLTTVIAQSNTVVEVFGPTAQNNSYYYRRDIVNYFTNHTYIVRPITCYSYATNISTNISTNYRYTFDNVVTNHFNPNSAVTLLTTNITSCSPVGCIQTNVTLNNIFTNELSGDFYIVPTNLCGYFIINTQFVQTVATTNLSFISTNGTNSSVIQSVISYWTNYNYTAQPLTCLAATTNITTTVDTNYRYTFGNVVTNRVTANSLETIVTTNIGQCPGGFAGILCTNVATTSVLTNVIAGDFYFVPTNFCGYSILNTQLVQVAASTNVLLIATNSDGSQFSSSVITYFTNFSFTVQPLTCLAITTNVTTAIQTNYLYSFDNLRTNLTTPTSSVTVITTNITQCPGAFAGVLCTNVVTNTFATNFLAGDLFIVPTNLCGYSILNTQLVQVLQTTNLLLTATNSDGSQYSSGIITYFTNFNFTVQPLICYVSVTNITTTNILAYRHVFDNVTTNHVTSTSVVTLVTTNIAQCPGNYAGVLCTNYSTNLVTTNILAGDFFIAPTNGCGLAIVSNIQTTVFATTNTQPLVTNSDGSTTLRSAIYYFTNYIVVINPVDCTFPGFSNSVALRRGIDRIRFVRRNYDSLIGRFFEPVTNSYQLTAITGNQPVIQNFRRVVSTPDILFSSIDMLSINNGLVNDPGVTRTISNYTFSGFTPAGQFGPGNRNPSVAITFDRAGQVLANSGPAFLDQSDATTLRIQWASFDGTTNEPVVYPVGADVASLENQILQRLWMVTPTQLPDAVVGNVYDTQLSAAGGYTPYGWTLQLTNTTVTNFPLGLTLSGGVISGIPSAANAEGVYSFIVRVTDSHNTQVARVFSIRVWALVVTTASVPAATYGQPYSQQLTATGGSTPYTWALAPTSAGLPGLSLSSDGILSGTPDTIGSFDFIVRVTDAANRWSDRTFTLTVNSPP